MSLGSSWVWQWSTLLALHHFLFQKCFQYFPFFYTRGRVPIPTRIIEMSMVFESTSYLGVLPSRWEFSGRKIDDHISAWYTNNLSQSCRGTSYHLIWCRKSLCDCWIPWSALLWNGDWGYVCDTFITPSSYSTFFQLVLLVIYHNLSECIWSGTPAYIK